VFDSGSLPPPDRIIITDVGAGLDVAEIVAVFREATEAVTGSEPRRRPTQCRSVPTFNLPNRSGGRLRSGRRDWCEALAKGK